VWYLELRPSYMERIGRTGNDTQPSHWQNIPITLIEGFERYGLVSPTTQSQCGGLTLVALKPRVAGMSKKPRMKAMGQCETRYHSQLRRRNWSCRKAGLLYLMLNLQRGDTHHLAERRKSGAPSPSNYFWTAPT